VRKKRVFVKRDGMPGHDEGAAAEAVAAAEGAGHLRREREGQREGEGQRPQAGVVAQ
jgi:hypothetical protein